MADDIWTRVETPERLTPDEKLVLDVQGAAWTFVYCPPTGPDGFLMGAPEDEVGRWEREKPTGAC